MEVLHGANHCFACIPGRMAYPGHSLTLIVKGTFTLSQRQKATPAAEQLYPTGDEFYPDDEGMIGAPHYESDFTYFKPRADLLLIGKCYVPEGRQAQSCTATFQVGNKSRSIVVFGERHWKRNALGFRHATDPAPFQAMEMRYENSYGGATYETNPIGKGFGKVSDESGTAILPLPSLENPFDLIDSPHAHPEPAGFGPLSHNWKQRRSKMGAYKGSYLKERWPWLPEDFDWTYFNAAPPEMQLEGYLRGDESLYFENLHRDHSQYEARLPGLRVRCFVNKSTDPADANGFVEAPMNLDTLWVDMESEKLVLVWRGWVETASEDHEEIRHVFIKEEELTIPADTIGDCHQQFLAAIAQENRKWETGSEGPVATTVPDAEPEQATANAQATAKTKAEEDEKQAEELKKQIEAQTANLLTQVGIDLNALPVEARNQLEQEQSRILQMLTNREPAKQMADEQMQLHSQLSDAFKTLGMDVNHLPPVSDKAKAEQFRFRKELGLGDVDSNSGTELSQFWIMMAALLPKMGIDPENLDSLVAEAKKQKTRIEKQLGVKIGETKEEGQATERPAPPASQLTRELVQERAQRGESFAGEDLRNLDLSGLQLQGLDFSRAILTGVSLKGTSVEDADFTEASLEGTDLAGACLNRTVLAKANLSKSNLAGASLKEIDATEAVFDGSCLRGTAIGNAVFERAKMTDAILDEATGQDAIFAEADLSGASLKKAGLPRADFSKSTLHNSNFQGADLTDSNVEAASGRNATFRDANLSGLRASEGCDFSQACFVKTMAAGSYWEGATLQDTDFSCARMEGANFTKALLERANFYASDVKFGRFMKANLRSAKLVQVNLFEGTLEKADLTETDLRGSNLYGAEFLDAHVEQTLLQDANLKMTKLQKG
jgi:uncharacterized protein YjbI with pentapeptide repeats